MQLWRYRGESWEPHEPAPQPLPRELRLVTLNLWFEAYAREERVAGQAALLKGLRPDILGVQEATLRMLEPLLAQDWVREEYWCSASSTSPSHTHGVVLLSRYGPARLEIDPLPGIMGRRLLWADFEGLRVGVVHLESLDSAHVRRQQLAQIFPRLAESPSAVLMGDFNLCSTWEENRGLDPAYLDLWPALHPDQPGWTEDTELNTMRLAARKKHKSVRFDRILLRSPVWQAQEVELIGNQPIGPDLFPSDHFGLTARLTT